MATLIADLMKKGYTQDEIFAVIFESERERKRRRMQAIVIDTVGAHRLQKMKEFVAYEKLATWRRKNGFDRIAADDNQWTSRPLPLTPEQFTQNLWSEVNALKNATSMPARTRPWQKTIEFVDRLQGKLQDEELGVIKRYVERRSGEAAQVTVYTVQHCSPCSLNPETPSDVHVKMEEKGEGKTDPELKEFKSSSAGTGFETPGQQCLNEGTLEATQTTTTDFVTACVGSSLGRNITSPTTESVPVDTRASTKSTPTLADTSLPTEHVGRLAATAATPENRRRKTPSEENKQFDPGGKGE